MTFETPSMKSCPTCNRTFGDEMVFCLVDGAILSAPFDPSATRQQQHPRTTEPAPTELISARSNPDPLPPTVTSPAPTLASPATTPLAFAAETASPKSSNSWRNVYVGLALTLAVSATLIFAYGRSSACPTITVKCIPYQEYAICQVSPTSGGAVLGESQTSQAFAGINLLAAAEPRRFADSVNVSWTTSQGVLGEPDLDGEVVRINTVGLTGQEITVTATLTGLGTFCSNTASARFKAGVAVPAR